MSPAKHAKALQLTGCSKKGITILFDAVSHSGQAARHEKHPDHPETDRRDFTRIGTQTKPGTNINAYSPEHC
ncbi:hypothetical protein AA21952_3099 [Acetobacter oeni LMG 21952]|nr:hypothetical protein AA21952_3099 [Acetobacter oeni LMG 21952]